MRISFSMLRAQLVRVLAPALTIAAAAACGSVSAKQPDAGGGGGDDAAASAVDAAIDAPPITCTETTCTNDVLEVCGSNGMVESTENCALGCYTDGTRCNSVAPSNGLASQLDQAAQQGDITLPDGAKINTDTGGVTAANGDTIAVATATVTQSSGPMLRVLIAKSWTINDVRVTGTLPLAFVASGEISIRGVLDASADGATAGPGAQACANAGAGGAPGTGFFEAAGSNSGGYPTYVWAVNGSGGGGYGSAGGAGGVRTADYAVGAAGVANGNATLTPLRGGCPGYANSGTLPGAGGGALQLVSGRRVHLVDSATAKGMVHVGGGGGRAAALGRNAPSDTTPVFASSGGGSGGAILVEAPTLVLDDGTALLAAGGGGGGFGACAPPPNGLDAPAGAVTPTGGACPSGTTPASVGGAGGTTAAGNVGGNSTRGAAGSGGGGLGRIRVNTADGQYTIGTNALVRGAASTGLVGKR